MSYTINKNKKLALFRFEASPSIGAGHAIRSTVLADALTSLGWHCMCVTESTSVEFIKDLKRFERIEPEIFDKQPIDCDILIIDHYDLDISYERSKRPYAKYIWVIDDLANRIHDCDLLLDQTYKREPESYKNLVPEKCKILTGSDYALLRQEFIKFRPQAINKRLKTTSIDRIMICMGGSDPKNYTKKALEMIKSSNFNGIIDIVVGFSEENKLSLKSYTENLVNTCFFHHNPNMAELMFMADLAIGAPGSGLWERCCLGLPSILMVTADNQKSIYNTLENSGNIFSLNDFLLNLNKSNIYDAVSNIVDGFGVNRVILEGTQSILKKTVTLKKVTKKDKDIIFSWQCMKEVRQYARHPKSPSYKEHEKWFDARLKKVCDPYWLICEESNPVGALSLTYDVIQSAYELSWYLDPIAHGRGIGTIAVKQAAETVKPFEIVAFVNSENIASHKALKKAGFYQIDKQNYRNRSVING